MPLLIAAALGVALVSVDTGATAGADDAAAVKAAFKTYQAALLKKDGARAAAGVDRGTIDYFQRMRDLAVAGKASELQKAPIMDKLMVVRIRHQVPAAEVKRMNGAGLFAYGVVQGWIGKEVANVEVGAIEVKGDRASAALMVGNKVSPTRMGLRREAGAWRVDLTSVFATANTGFKKAQEESGMSEDNFIFKIVETLSGEPVPPTIWNPPK